MTNRDRSERPLTIARHLSCRPAAPPARPDQPDLLPDPTTLPNCTALPPCYLPSCCPDRPARTPCSTVLLDHHSRPAHPTAPPRTTTPTCPPAALLPLDRPTSRPASLLPTCHPASPPDRLARAPTARPSKRAIQPPCYLFSCRLGRPTCRSSRTAKVWRCGQNSRRYRIFSE